jgi:molecular chaperone DnaJ/curved DNA-binding protein
VPAPKDYYAVLGVAEDAPADAIKKAYRRLARQHHPDKNPGDKAAEDKFKEVQEAYDTVGDAERRKQYDRERRDPYAGRFDGPGGPFAGFGAGGRDEGVRFYRAPDGTYVRVETTGAGPEADYIFGGGGGIGDIFGDIFGAGAGGTRRRPREAPAQDAEATLRLSLDDALRGGPQTFRIGDETLRLEVPQGVRPGYKVRLRGKGPAGPDGRRGDLYLVVDVAPHPRLRREGDDLVMTETISAVEAMLGTRREVEAPYGGRVRLRIPPGTQPGERLRLRGQGVRTGDRKGDLFVEIRVEVAKLSDEARAGLEKWAKEAGLGGEE